YALDLTEGKLRLTIGGDTLIADAPLASGKWSHVTGTYDGANLRLYINGVSAGNLERTGGIPVNALTLLMGKGHGNNGALSGRLDEVRLYGAALTADEIQTLAKAPARALAITGISPSRPASGQPFAVTVQAQDANGDAAGVLNSTSAQLLRKTGTGSLTGNNTMQFAAGQNTVTFTNMVYNKVENGVALTASRFAGDILTAGDSAPFNVTLPSSLVVTRIRPARPAPAPATFAVEVQAQNNSGQPVPVSAATDVLLTKKAGAGTLGGVLIGAIPAGQSSVIITGVTYSQNDTGVQVTAARGAAGDQVGSGDSAAFVVNSTPVTLNVTSTIDGHDAQPGDGTCATRPDDQRQPDPRRNVASPVGGERSRGGLRCTRGNWDRHHTRRRASGRRNRPRVPGGVHRELDAEQRGGAPRQVHRRRRRHPQQWRAYPQRRHGDRQHRTERRRHRQLWRDDHDRFDRCGKHRHCGNRRH
ncbi:MAG: LamG domain-containing protein, partial [Chloroflexi bacterium]|nr:LamG domain-containing protein [Chloroflexota bacterium]